MKKLNTLIKGLTVFRKQLVLVLISLSIVFNLKAEDGSNTVVDIIVNSPDHTTLEAAVLAAELEGALSGEGPFTVFAPTDDAFAALPEGTVDALLNDIPALTAILTYHVAGGKVLSTDLSDGMVITTLNGKDVTVSITGEGVFINDAKVTVADIPADNGVVHVIDAVLIPPVVTVVDIIVNSPDHTTLEAAVLAAELEGALSGEGPFTVFAPTDDAFAALPEGTVDALLNDIPALTAILTYHVAGGKVLSTDLSDGMVVTTLNGKDVTVSITGEGVFINDAKVMVADIPADNGVVHVIDAVLIPPASTNVLNRVAAERMFKVYPNPAENYLNINLLDDYTGKPGTISIVRIDGTQIMEISTKDSIYNLDVSHLSSGIYFVLMKTGNKVYSEKLIIKQ